MDVPAGALPDGTVVTVNSVDEAAFPVKLTADQQRWFAFAGGIRLDFGGVTPAQYVNVSIPAVGGETPEDRWIVGQIVQAGARQLLNVVDTARIIDGRITTSSPPCPGVQAAALYGILKSAGPIGVNYGRFTNPTPAAAGMVVGFSQPMLGAMIALPYALMATPTPADVCFPVLSGRVTVQPNSQKVVLDAVAFTPLDREIIIRNIVLNREFHFPRNVAEYRFLVDGTVADTFNVAVIVNGTEQRAAFTLSAAGPGLVNVRLDISRLNVSVSEVVIRSLTRGFERRFPQSTAAVNLAVPGGSGDGYEVTIVDAAGNPRRVEANAVVSSSGPGNLLARTLPGTIDPDTDVTLDVLDSRGAVVDSKTLTDKVTNGGFTFDFDDEQPDVHFYRVMVAYRDGRAPVSIGIPSVVIAMSEPVSGRVISTTNALVAAVDEPYNLGAIKTDVTPPFVTKFPEPADDFDPVDPLTFTFSEGIDRVTALFGMLLEDEDGKNVAGTARLSNGNRTVTFVPNSPLRMGATYTLHLKSLADGSGNRMPDRSFEISTLKPAAQSPDLAGLAIVRALTLVRKSQPDGTIRTFGFGIAGDLGQTAQMVALDMTVPTEPTLLSSTFVGDGGRVAVLPDVAGLPLHGDNPCGTGNSFSGDLALVAAYDVGKGAAVRFYDVSDPAAPCALGAKLLAFNPAIGPAQGVVASADAFARAVAALKNGDGWISFTAVDNVGLMQVDIGDHIPALNADQRVLEPFASGNYVDVVAAGGRLLAVQRSSPTLDIFDGSLTLLSSTQLPMREARTVAYTEGMAIDFNHDGQIGQDEVRNFAFVGGTGAVTIVDITEAGAPVVVGTVAINATVTAIDVDPASRRLFVGGYASDAGQEWRLTIIDLSGRDPFPAVDDDGDGKDDRITWQSPPGAYGAGVATSRAVRFDTETGTLYVGTAKGIDVYRIDANLRGEATYTYYPGDRDIGLDYVRFTPLPIRGATVELHDGADAVVARTTTDSEGRYAFRAPVGELVKVVVVAALGQPGKETVRVVDNTNSNRLWEKASEPFVMPFRKTLDLYAETTWDPAAARYVRRDGAPFAILDMAFQAQSVIHGADPTLVFPLLKMAWSPRNRPNAGPANVADGAIQTSHYNSSVGTLFILGAENVDTDEYDRQVVLHEWNHYFQDKFSRDDTLGGSHAFKSIMDPRVAFSEGFATAFASMYTGDPLYIDTSGRAQRDPSVTDLEKDAFKASGMYSEDAVIELLWDLFDPMGSEPDAESETTIADNVALGFKPLYDAMRDGVKNTSALTSIYAFSSALLKPYLANPLDKATVADNIIALANAENIDIEHADEFEQFTTKSISLRPPFAVPVGRLYTYVPVDGTLVVNFGTGTPYAGTPLRTLTDFDAGGVGNRLYDHIFFKFTVTSAGTYVVTVTPTGDEAVRAFVSAKGKKTSGAGFGLGEASVVTVPLQPGTYVADVATFAFAGGKFVPGDGHFTIRINQP